MSGMRRMANNNNNMPCNQRGWNLTTVNENKNNNSNSYTVVSRSACALSTQFSLCLRLLLYGCLSLMLDTPRM